MSQHHQFREPGLVYQFFTAPWIWAAAMTWGFYTGIPHLPVGKELALRYFCGHPLERVLAALFFVGLAIILVKGILLVFEWKSFAEVKDFGIASASEDLEANVLRFQSHLTSQSQTLENTVWGRRLEHLLAFFKGRKNGEGLGEHLVYLSESAVDRLQSSHALLQTVIWSIPILGFLGTVMGITLAIANVTPDQLDTSLDAVTGGLAVAFDTTALALSLSLILGFASLFVKRSEERLLGEIDERCRLEVHRCFPVGAEHAGHPLIEAESKAAEALLQQTAELITEQTASWTSTLEDLRTKWTDTLARHQQQLAGSFSEGTESTLANHAELLKEFRQEFLAAQQRLSQDLTANIEALGTSRQNAESEMLTRLLGLAEQINLNADRHASTQQRTLVKLLDEFSARIDSWQDRTDGWQQQIGRLTEAMQHQSEALLGHGGQLLRIVEQEESLIRLQGQLDRNLEAVHAGETFEQTMHNLTAAVHLLTARARMRDAA